MRHGRNRRRDDIHAAPGGPWIVTIYCLCGDSFTQQDRSKQNAQRIVVRKLTGHLTDVKKTL